jgi:hypothetical protein
VVRQLIVALTVNVGQNKTNHTTDISNNQEQLSAYLYLSYSHKKVKGRASGPIHSISTYQRRERRLARTTFVEREVLDDEAERRERGGLAFVRSRTVTEQSTGTTVRLSSVAKTCPVETFENINESTSSRVPSSSERALTDSN